MKTRVLVTGGSGFIGSHLVQRLLQDGAEVGVTVRYGNVVKSERLRGVWPSIHVIEADLRNRGALRQVADFAPKVVFHLAAYNHVGESFTQVEECFDVNAKGTANLLDTCGAGLDKFVYVSTSEVYGLQDSEPFTESMCPQPISPYAITKYAGELYCRMKQRMAGICPITVVRPFNAFGPYQSSKAIIPELILNCLRGKPIRSTPGEQTREFNFVGNLVDGMVLAAESAKATDGPINLAAGEEIAIASLIRQIAALTGSHSPLEIGALPYRPTEIWRMSGDNRRAKELLNWSPRISLEKGLTTTIDWYRTELDRNPAGLC